ncbi:MAG: gluconokinase [Chloroflexi bacterium]|nr:gluconokinase [Chloroflexota bacterium]MCL5108154.1 gluconokinase [Chloroflexota bacterium]
MKIRVIGLDIGTTGTRAVVFDELGQVYASASCDYPLLVPHPGYGEQEPDSIVRAVVCALKDAVARAALRPEEVSAIGVSAVMHSTLALDREGKPLTNAWTWVDTRAAPQATRLKREHEAAAYYVRSGCPVHAMYTPAKVAHIRETLPDIFARADRFATIKEYVLWRLFGARVIDYGIASGSGCLNMEAKDWDAEALAMAGIGRERLAELVEPTTLIQGLKPEFAREIGVSAAVPLAVGSSDGTLSSLGSGAVAPGQMTAMIGTSGAVRAITDRPVVDPRGRTWCYYLADDRWVPGAAINNGGIVYRWLRDDILRVPEAAREDAYQAMDEAAARVPAGAHGLVFLPFLAGERAPFWNADARGVLFGLSLRHGQGHLVRATLEGVAYRMFSIFAALRDIAGPPHEVRAAGGFTKSRLWLQILADIFGVRLHVPVVAEASAWGAAYLALMGLGVYRSIDQMLPLVPIASQVPFDPASHDRYQRLFELYMRLYWHLQDQFTEISSLQREETANSR